MSEDHLTFTVRAQGGPRLHGYQVGWSSTPRVSGGVLLNSKVLGREHKPPPGREGGYLPQASHNIPPPPLQIFLLSLSLSLSDGSQYPSCSFKSSTILLLRVIGLSRYLLLRFTQRTEKFHCQDSYIPIFPL